ncbi:MAG: GCN5-related N-acetyltransferase [Verrucomicrobia bacterium]|jgi:GNAT superfamily N-acetyltransferase|nr:GCN5-related N-acetyltransferase [Verrucomicrobiota bacterium]
METHVNRLVREEEVDRLLPVVEEFYAHFGFAWDTTTKRRLLVEFLQRPELGRLWVAVSGERIVGYALVPYYFGLEFDGVVGLLDEFFISPAARGQGAGARLLKEVMSGLPQEGITKLRLEVDGKHPEAARLYERLGFVWDGRETWSKAI